MYRMRASFYAPMTWPLRLPISVLRKNQKRPFDTSALKSYRLCNLRKCALPRTSAAGFLLCGGRE